MGFSTTFLRCFLLFVVLGSESVYADDCAFVRAALKNLPASGGEFIVPDGTYNCATPIILDRDNLTLRGSGHTKFRLADNSNVPMIIMGAIETPPRLVKGVQVMDLVLDGNRTHQQIECWGGPCDSGRTSNIRNNGITVRGVTNGVIKNISILSPRSGGVVTEKGCVGLLIDGVSVADSEFDGFAGYETTASTLTHLDLSHNASAGISIDIRFHGNTIRDSVLTGNRDVGIFMRYANGNHFENLVISDSGNHGIFVAEAEDTNTCPLDNEFFNLTVVRSRGFGFLLNNDCAGNKLTGTATFKKNTSGCFRDASAGKLDLAARIICED
jgi:parallel beta-helix repeat protein